jgi:pyruvyltransferase
MITIGYSTKQIDPQFTEYIKKSCGIPKAEIIPFENPGTHSLTEAYNIILEKSTNDIVVLCHDDIYFEKNNWGNKILKHFKRNPEYGILGVAGSTKLPSSAKWWEDPSRMRGIVNHEHEGKKWESKYSPSLGNNIDPVVLVDGLFMVLDKTKIKQTFGEEIEGFHLYDVDFCVKNFVEEVNIGVIYDIRITHKSIGQTNQQWEDNREKFAQIHSDKLPLRIVPNLDIDSPIKVLLSCLFFKNYTGSEMYVYELAKELVKLNCDVTVLSDTNGPLSKQAKSYGIKSISLPEYPGFKVGDGRWGFNTPNGFQPSQPNMLYKVGNADFDIIHTQHKPITEKMVELYPNIPKLATIHSEVISLEDPIINDTIREYVAIRPEIKDKMVNVDGVDESKISVVYNPIDSSRFNTEKTKDDGYILFVGTIDYLREQSIRDIANYAKEQGKELWLVGHNSSNYLPELLTQSHIKHFEATNQVEKYVKNCSETAGILLGRTTIEGWMCGKPGWIYEVDETGNIKGKERYDVPSDIDKFNSKNVALSIKERYLNIIKEWENHLDDVDKKKHQRMIFNGRKITPDNTKNWGDLVPFNIIDKLFNNHGLSDSDVFNVKNPNKPYKVYSTGSVMHFTKRDSIVWGTGCIDKGAIGDTPKKVYAVRGPLTRNELLKRGIECPEIYGDPALLYPMIYNPKIEKKYKWGIIPHYIEFESDKDIDVLKNLEQLGFKIIDISSGEEEFINQVLEVENVISSSLHGLIIADAYGIPNTRVNISNKLIGGDFKFKDYCMSVGREIDLGFQLYENTTLEEISELHFNKSIEFDSSKLLNSSPWEIK